ncbi:MAG: UDP-glucuronosyltransferase [Bacteroidia bacterium]|nr:UDP-glucuronosyltransferase [Bacteroidia bacterium]
MKILYGVPGEGMGHATRSKEVIDFLIKKGFDVQIVSSHKAFTFLKNHFTERVHEIKGLHFGFKDGKVSKWETFNLNLKKGPKNFLFNFSEFLKTEKNFDPDLVISDFESFSWAFAKLHRLPLISIDNMQVMDRCKLEIKIPAAEKNNFLLARNIVRAKVPGAEKYLVTSFFDAKVLKKNTEIVPPIIRKAIQSAKTTVGKHILVYQSAGSAGQLKKVFLNFPDVHFIAYGTNKDELISNIHFKLFSEDGFVSDFASCAAVIANGGFSFLSEAVYLKKPVYSFPLNGQFEQYMNAAYIEKCGYGKNYSELTKNDLSVFLSGLETFRKNFSAYKQKGNEILFDRLATFLNECNKSK